jgi:hypothetical protein
MYWKYLNYIFTLLYPLPLPSPPAISLLLTWPVLHSSPSLFCGVLPWYFNYKYIVQSTFFLKAKGLPYYQKVKMGTLWLWRFLVLAFSRVLVAQYLGHGNYFAPFSSHWGLTGAPPCKAARAPPAHTHHESISTGSRLSSGVGCFQPHRDTCSHGLSSASFL